MVGSEAETHAGEAIFLPSRSLLVANALPFARNPDVTVCNGSAVELKFQ